MTPTSSLRLAATLALAALALPGCTALLEPDPLNKTTSIVNGTQVTRGPSRGTVASGFADTAAPSATSFEPAVGEPFDVEDLSLGLSEADLGLPELQGIDFPAEEASISGIIESGTVTPTDGSAYSLAEIGQTVYFATDSSELNERARETLRRQAAWLNVNPQTRVTIEGHADERGTREYNLALGERRASATRGYLIAVGVDESRLDKISYGKERPVALGSNEQAWAQNRRTETVIDGNGGTFANNPIDAPIQTSAFDAGPVTTPLEAISFDTGVAGQPFPAESPFPAGDALISGTSDSLILDPLYPQEGTTALISPPNQINYESTSGLYAPPVQQPPIYNSGAIAPTVFDTTTVAPTVYDTTTVTPTVAPVIYEAAPAAVVPTPSVTSATRIEDVSVDDLLRDPSLIDRIGSPPVTTPGN